MRSKFWGKVKIMCEGQNAKLMKTRLRVEESKVRNKEVQILK